MQCFSDIDDCEVDPCYPGVDCYDFPAPERGFSCGDCPAGLKGDGITCISEGTRNKTNISLSGLCLSFHKFKIATSWLIKLSQYM